MNKEIRPLVTYEPFEYEKLLVEVQGLRKITDHFRRIYGIYIHPNLRNVTPFLYPKILGKTNVLSLNPPPCGHISLSYIMDFEIRMIHQRISTTRSHASCCHCCHYCNVALCVIP